MGLNPLDWYGTEFLLLYGGLFVAALVGAFRIAASLRPEGRRSKLTEADELAVLHLGKERFAEVVAARLLQRGALKVEKSRLVRMSSSGGERLKTRFCALATGLAGSRCAASPIRAQRGSRKGLSGAGC